MLIKVIQKLRYTRNAGMSYVLKQKTLKVGENKESFIEILGDFDQDIAINEILNSYEDNIYKDN